MKRPVLIALAVLALVRPPAAGAQSLEDYDYENLSFRGIGADWGRIWPNKVEPAHVYGLRFDLGFLGPGVRISPSVHYWNSAVRRGELERLARQLSQFGAVVTADQLGPIEWSSLSLGIDGHVVWTTPIRVLTYVGGGTALHALNGRGAAIDDTFVEDLLDTVTAAFSLLGGLEFEPVDRVRIYGEARYTLMSEVRYPGIRVGAALMLGGGEAGVVAAPSR